MRKRIKKKLFKKFLDGKKPTSNEWRNIYKYLRKLYPVFFRLQDSLEQEARRQAKKAAYWMDVALKNSFLTTATNKEDIDKIAEQIGFSDE